MFDWLFPPSCPCDPAAKAWIEERLRWLCGQFDDHIFKGQALVLPTPEFFPDPYDGSREAVRTLLDRVCGYMGVDPLGVDLELTSLVSKLQLVNDQGEDLPSTAGTFENQDDRSLIRLDTGSLDQPMDLVGTIAHELAHARLLGEGRVDADVWDHELLTDLTTVFLGFGVFLANGPRNWDSQYTSWPGTDLKKPEYMTLPMYGYALALLAWSRAQAKPPWLAHLRWNARVEVKEGIRYLLRTGDSTFKPA